MKQNESKNPYATNRGGRIEAPIKQTNEPRSSKISGDDKRK